MMESVERFLFADSSDGISSSEHQAHIYLAGVVLGALVFLVAVRKGLGKAAI